MAAVIRTVLALAATVWFAYNAATFLPDGAGLVINPGNPGGIDGDGGAVAVTSAARTLFAGLALISAALIDWSMFRLPDK
jgi:hypothetical protein